MTKEEIIKIMLKRNYTLTKEKKVSLHFKSVSGIKAHISLVNSAWRVSLYLEWQTHKISTSSCRVTRDNLFKEKEKDLHHIAQNLNISNQDNSLIFVGPNADPKILEYSMKTIGIHPITEISSILSNYYGGWKELLKENRPRLIQMLGEKLISFKKNKKLS